MKIICLHGAGTNNEVRIPILVCYYYLSIPYPLNRANNLLLTGDGRYLKTKQVSLYISELMCILAAGWILKSKLRYPATLRSLLSDFDFEFVEGTVLHPEGSWSRYYPTYQSSVKDESIRYTYFKPRDFQSMWEAELSLIELLQEESPPFDGVLAYSVGCALAAQVFLRHAGQRNKAIEPQLFKFAIFCNGLTPYRTHPLDKLDMNSLDSNDTALKEDIIQVFNSVAELRRAGAPHLKELIAQTRLSDIEWVKQLEVMMLTDGTSFLTDGKFGIARFDSRHFQLSIPTLHIRDSSEPKHFGLGLLELCDPKLVKDFHHMQGHEFPRGYHEMEAIARLVRQVADMA